MNLHTKDYPGYTVVFKTTCYPDYLVLCERLGWVPMGTREYFSVGV